MRRRFNPWVVVITAALTFSSLLAFVGPRSIGYRSWDQRGYSDYDHHRYNHGGCNGVNSDRAAEKNDSSLTQ